jgi:predicted membrane chloride channel (bestrophin family)
MSEHFGTMTRIAQTPIPFNYAQFIKLLVVCADSL